MFLADLLAALGDVAFLRFLHDPTAPLPPLTISVAIAVLASLSTLAGHSFILLVNGIRGLRFVVALLIGLLLIAVLALIQGVTFWLSAGPITGRLPPLTGTTAAVLASTAPLTLGFLVLIPHLGILIGRILQGWQAVCLWLLGVVLLGTSWWQALLVAGSSWLLMQVGSRLFGRPLGWLVGRVWSLVTGRTTMLSATDILAGTPFIPVETKARP